MRIYRMRQAVRRVLHRVFGHGEGPFKFAGYGENPYLREWYFCESCYSLMGPMHITRTGGRKSLLL